MSINKLVSVKVPINDAINQLGIERIEPVFTRWAIQAEKEIRSKYQFKKQIAVLPVTDCIAKLPSNAARVQRAILGDRGCNCEDLFNQVCAGVQLSSATLAAAANGDGSFLVLDITDGVQLTTTSIPHQVQDNKLIFDQNLDAQNVTVQYLGYETDSEGFIKVGENHLLAIMWNIIWRYYFRMRRPSPMDISKMREAKAEWHRECSNARARDAEMSESDQNAVNAMLHDPLVGWGLELDFA